MRKQLENEQKLLQIGFSPRGAQMQKSIEQYFGKDELMRLKAQDIKNKLMRPIISKLKQGGDLNARIKKTLARC